MKDTLQDQLLLTRRNHILDAAARVFAQKGFHPTTIKDIAREAGVADGTLYNYFENKTALLLGIFDRMKTTIMADSMPPAPDALDLRALLRLLIQQPLMALKHDNFALFRVVMSEMLVNEELRALYNQEILQPTLLGADSLLQQHLLAQGIAPEKAQLLLRTISSLVMGLMVQTIMGDETLANNWDTLPDLLTTLLLDGLQGTPA